jgi:hypothetical protein
MSPDQNSLFFFGSYDIQNQAQDSTTLYIYIYIKLIQLSKPEIRLIYT